MSYSKTFQKDSNIGKSYNQSYVDITYEMLQDKLEYLCKSYGILLVMPKKSYISKVSFWDKSKEYHFNGKRIYRGQVLNADVNGALNILSKSNVVATSGLYDRGDVDSH